MASQRWRICDNHRAGNTDNENYRHPSLKDGDNETADRIGLPKLAFPLLS
jgi:hypothetical protein